MVKPPFGEPISEKTYLEVISILEDNLKILHPFVPFISEEIWQHITQRDISEALIVSKWPAAVPYDGKIIKDFGFASEVISGIRTIRKEKNISFKDSIELAVINHEKSTAQFDPLISKLGNVSHLSYSTKKLEGALTFRVKSNEYFIPISDTIDVAEEIAKVKGELKYIEGFLKSVQGKLRNERFMSGAPDQVIALEKQKEADAIAKIETLKNSLRNLE